MDAHIEGVALRSGEVLVPQVPRERAAGKPDAHECTGHVEEPELPEGSRQPQGARRRHETPTVNRTESNHVNAVEQSRPNRNDQRHGDQRNDGGGKNRLQVAGAKAVF